jgi:hypothetical protein
LKISIYVIDVMSPFKTALCIILAGGRGEQEQIKLDESQQ